MGTRSALLLPFHLIRKMILPEELKAQTIFSGYSLLSKPLSLYPVLATFFSFMVTSFHLSQGLALVFPPPLKLLDKVVAVKVFWEPPVNIIIRVPSQLKEIDIQLSQFFTLVCPVLSQQLILCWPYKVTPLKGFSQGLSKLPGRQITREPESYYPTF